MSPAKRQRTCFAERVPVVVSFDCCYRFKRGGKKKNCFWAVGGCFVLFPGCCNGKNPIPLSANFIGIRKWEQSGWQVARMELHSLQEALKVEIQCHHQVNDESSCFFKAERASSSLASLFGVSCRNPAQAAASIASRFGCLSQGRSIDRGGGGRGCLPLSAWITLQK